MLKKSKFVCRLGVTFDSISSRPLAGRMKLTTDASVPVYTIAGEGTARPLPEWLARKRKRSLKKDSEYANRVELLQDFEFEEASQCVRVSEDGEWVVSTGTSIFVTSTQNRLYRLMY